MKRLLFCFYLIAYAGCISHRESESVSHLRIKDNVNESINVSQTPPSLPSGEFLRDAQSRFGPEYEFKRKSAVPSEIWSDIVSGEDNLDLKTQLLSANNAALWVWGSRIDLNEDNFADYIVMAFNPPLAGANVTTFWVVLFDDGKFRSVLKTSALQIDILESRRNGLRIVRGVQCTVADCIEVRFEYNGEGYEPVSRKRLPRK